MICSTIFADGSRSSSSRGDRVRVVNDAIGSQPIFYQTRSRFCVGSHPSLVAEAVGAERDPEVVAYLADPAYASRYLPGDRTMFHDVRALAPNNLIDSQDQSTRRYWPRSPLQPSSRAAFDAALDAHLAALGAYATQGRQAVFGLSGGVDTRVAMAAFLHMDLPFRMITWWYERLERKERRIVDELAAIIPREHRKLSAAAPTGRIAAMAARDAAGIRSPDSRTMGLHEAFNERPDCLFLIGWGAEVVRGFYTGKNLPVMDLADAEAMSRTYTTRPLSARSRDFARKAFEEFISNANYRQIDGLGYPPGDIFYWEHRLGMWGASYHLELDVGIRSVSVYNSRRLFQAAFGLPDGERIGKRLFLDAVGRYAPELAALPLADGDPRAVVSVDRAVRANGERGAISDPTPSHGEAAKRHDDSVLGACGRLVRRIGRKLCRWLLERPWSGGRASSCHRCGGRGRVLSELPGWSAGASRDQGLR